MDKLLACAAVSVLFLLSRSMSPAASASISVRRYDSIFSFGNSLADTGNNLIVFDWYSVFNPVTRPPYGSTYFGRPTGRDCDGRLIIDFIAQSLALPLVPPFLVHNGSFRHGANFAVGGATALDAAFFHDGEAIPQVFPVNTSLAVQLQWFESLKPSLCSNSQECSDLFSKSLFLVGEFGLNDYSFLLGKRSVQQVRSVVPDIIATISVAIERLIKHGATNLVVAGMPPAGCAPPFILLLAEAAGPADYDSRTGCLIQINELCTYHNSLLRQALDNLQAKHLDVDIIYADFFSPIMEIVESPAKFGFARDVLTVCCGGPGKYHYNEQVICGAPGSIVCKDPAARIFWDGVHLTEAANRVVARSWMSSINSPRVPRRVGAEQPMIMDKLLACAGVSILFLLSRSVSSAAAASISIRRRYDSIFSFGDSFADTGNNLVVFDWYSLFNPVTRPPYGSTYFGRPTGRNCDGRLIIDFVAQSLGLPLLPPFVAHNGSFRHGANFAVGGATALDAGFFHNGESDQVFPLNTSLAVQLQWFESLKPSLCSSSKECRELLSRSLFFVGEFGFNDYSFLLGGRSVPQVRSVVPDVIANISMAIERLIKHGATSLVVPGIPPAGCAPPIINLLAEATDPADYDSRTGCLSEVNELSTYHNSLLRQALDSLQAKHSDMEIIYADFFGPIMEIVESPAKFGFAGDVLTVCCGGPGKYHFNEEVFCGAPGATVCKDPAARLFWDGVHLTEAANRFVARSWMNSINSPASANS